VTTILTRGACRKQQVTASDALELLFKKQLPDIFDISDGE